jgi:hypothetical protein
MGDSCPVCGAQLERQLGQFFVSCRYCRTAVTVAGNEVLLRYLVAQRLTQEAGSPVPAALDARE